MSPFQALYGRSVPDCNAYIPGSSDTPSIDSSLQEHERLRKLLKANLLKAQQRMMSLANAHRMDKQFSVGDMVFLRLKDYRQHLVSSHASKKLSKRFYGPFKILERIGLVAYRLELPYGSKVHPLFHISLLREAHGNPAPIPLPQVSDTADQLEEIGTQEMPQLEDDLNVKRGAVDTGQSVVNGLRNRPTREVRKPARFSQ
ncbi:uncharacterized protein LOC110876036 [Helianthus annuus]|uniref:uncharacterized protein LOC110876036 n=1 Tax=Helianthus annuus TaxID=4232 RepID=UPI000B8FD992|nr:uncharacterized protein LOC110876036 [Helianthus annuus]